MRVLVIVVLALVAAFVRWGRFEPGWSDISNDERLR